MRVVGGLQFNNMNQQPLVSIIIPTYNRENLLKDAILSVLVQTCQDFELIVVDDCSKDDTNRAVEDFKDARIIYLRHNENKGVATACNTGIKRASGDYLFILNDDDLIVPWAIERLIDKINKSEVKNLGGVYGWSWWVDDKGKTLRINNSSEKGYIFEKILKSQIFTNLLIKKEIFQEIGLYDENLRNNEDFDFYLKIAKNYNFDFIPEITTVIRGHNQSHLSTFSKKNITGAGEIFKKHSNNIYNKKNLFALIFPSMLYVKLSIFKNFVIYQIKSIFYPEIKKQIILIKESFFEQGIKI